jgi:alpha-1,2-mannosyltransferase
VRRAERSTGNDLVGYLAASEALYAGADPYHLPNRFPYIYPLFLAAILRPLVPLGVRAASVLWFVLQCVCLAYIVSGARSRARGYAAGAMISLAILVAIFGDVLQSEFLNGQVNLLVVALVVAAVRLEDSHQRAAAVLLGAAIALKLTPALLLAYWWIRGRYAGACEAIAWAAAFMLAPWLIVRARLWPLYDTYLREVILPRAGLADSASGDIFFSIYGFWGWVTRSPAGQLTIVLLSAALLAGLMVWHWRLTRRPATDSMPAAWLYLASMPLVSPMSEVHHLVALLPIASFVRPWTGVVRALFALFVVLLWIGRFDRTGPWYLFAIAALVAAGAAALRYSATPPPSATRT